MMKREANKKKILIYTEPFLPPAYLPRVKYFCNYFVEQGWKVHLVTESSDLVKNLPENIPTLVVDYYYFKNKILAKIEWGVKFLFNLIWDYKGRYFYKKSKELWNNNQYNAVFASSCFIFPLTTAMRVARKIDVPFVVDLRDIIEQSPDDNYYMSHQAPKLFGNTITKIYKAVTFRRRNNVLRQANGVTTVSPWHVETLSKYNRQTHLIYNGFDDTMFSSVVEKTEKFTIAYFGRIFNLKLRNPELLFQAVKRLYEKKVLTPNNTVIKWYVDDTSKAILEDFSKQYELEAINDYYDFLKPEHLSNELNKSSVVLVINNNPSTKRYFGIMTTKFYEAVGANRPILCFPDSQKYLAELISKNHCGVASSEVSKMEFFLKEQFEKWQVQRYTLGNLDEETRLSFSRRSGAKKIEDIFLNELIKSHK